MKYLYKDMHGKDYFTCECDGVFQTPLAGLLRVRITKILNNGIYGWHEIGAETMVFTSRLIPVSNPNDLIKELL